MAKSKRKREVTIPSVARLIAEEPVNPSDRSRPIENVVNDHAIKAWGLIRDAKISDLDSEAAVSLLNRLMTRLLASVQVDDHQGRDKLMTMKAVGGKLARTLKAISSQTPNYANGDNRVRCKHCEAFMSTHLATCPVGKMLKEAHETGFITLDEL